MGPRVAGAAGSAPAQPRGEHQGRAACPSPSGAPSGGLPDKPPTPIRPPAVTPLALVVLEEDPAARTPARRWSTWREAGIWDLKADLRRRGPKTVTGGASRGRHSRRKSVSSPADDLPEDHRVSRPYRGRKNTIFWPQSDRSRKKALVSALAEAGALRRHDRRRGQTDVPGPEARQGWQWQWDPGSQITKGIADIVLLKGPVSRGLSASDHRGPAGSRRNIHRLGPAST